MFDAHRREFGLAVNDDQLVGMKTSLIESVRLPLIDESHRLLAGPEALT